MRKFVGLKKIKSDKMNIEINKKNKDKCPHCNSIERMDGDEEIHCKNCGIGIEKIGFDESGWTDMGFAIHFGLDICQIDGMNARK